MDAPGKLASIAIILTFLNPPALFSQAPAPAGALSPANLDKTRPKAPFNLTGTWLHDNKDGPNSWRFVPPTFKLTPEAQKEYDAGQKAAKEGKVYRDDIGQCWPSGMPLIMSGPEFWKVVLSVKFVVSTTRVSPSQWPTELPSHCRTLPGR